MQKAILIHNPGCSKSISAKKILVERGLEFETIDYLKCGLNEELLSRLPRLLNLLFEQMIRVNEDDYKDLNLSEKSLSDREWVNLIIKYPILIQRPILIYGNKAIIARPVELILEII